MSLHGFREMQRTGLTNATYIPHGVDTHVFRPRQPSKALFGVNNETFVVGVIATNIEALDRKGWYPTLAAFGKFHAKHPDSILYVHASAGREDGGFDLIQIADSFNFKLHVPDMWTLSAGIPTLKMVELYNSFDVMMLLTRGEGFCVPLLEAQSCGVPVITTDFTAPADLVGGGWKVPSTGTRYTPLGSFWAEPDIDAGVRALEQCYQLWKAGELREEMAQKARAFAKTFDFDLVYKTHMRPFLKRVEEELAATERPAHLSCRVAGHEWADTKVVRGNEMLVPCLHRGCSAGLNVSPKGQFIVSEAFPLSFDGIGLDLEDHPVGGVVKSIIGELGRAYGLDSVQLKPGDVAIDIGAHVGVVSIYLAKRWPGIKVYAYEPSRDNYERLVRNIQTAGVGESVIAKNLAVTGDGRTIALRGRPDKNSGGLSIFGAGNAEDCPSTTLGEIFKENNIERCALLKVDCEGAEYEILYGADELLRRVDHLSAEFHLDIPDQNAEDLVRFCSERIEPSHINIMMGEQNAEKTTEGDDGVRQATSAEQGRGVHNRQQRPSKGNGRGSGGNGHSSSKRRRHRIRPGAGNGSKGQVQVGPEREGDRETVPVTQ
jgi:FkbM family methyltransferase